MTRFRKEVIGEATGRVEPTIPRLDREAPAALKVLDLFSGIGGFRGASSNPSEAA